MYLTRKVRTLAAATLTLLALGSVTSAARAQPGSPSCASCPTCTSCVWLNCPPCSTYWSESGPKISVQCGCPKPVCCPSDAPNWGYYQRSWRPWPWAPAAPLLPPLSEAAMPSAPHVVPLPH
jgi:hypothetical protein